MDGLTGEHTQNSKHGKTPILNLHIQSPKLKCALVVQLEAKVSSTEVTRGLIHSLHGSDEDFMCTNEERHLYEPGQRHNIKSSEQKDYLI